jgi:TRAP-type C4-dicarboxylate transport system permease small subunit
VREPVSRLQPQARRRMVGLMRVLNRAARVLEIILEIVSGLLLVSLTAIVIYSVFWRYIGGASPRWYDEIASIMLVWLTYYAGALTALKRGHISVDNLLMRMPPRARLATAIVGEVVVISFFALLAWAGLVVLQVLSGLSLISLRWVPITVTQSVIPIGAGLFIVAQLLSMPAYLAKVRAGISKEQEEIEHAVAEAERIEREADEVISGGRREDRL